MMISRDTSSENDVLYQFALSYRHPDPQQLDEFVRRYPRYAEALTTLAIELALEELTDKDDTAAVDTAEVDTVTAAMLSRAMSRFQNRLHAVHTSARAAVWSLSAQIDQPRDLFGQRTAEQMQIVTKELDASPLFVMRLRDRGIECRTMTMGFIQRLAEVLQEPEAFVLAYLKAPGQGHMQLYKSGMTPTVGRKLSFKEAVRTSQLTPEQQAKLLAL